MVDVKDPQAARAAIELFYFAYRAFTTSPDRILERRGLARVHHRILYFVGRNPSIKINELLSILRVSKQALNPPLRQLMEMSLICATVPAEDRRVRRLSLTSEGRRLETQLTATQTRQLRGAFASAGEQASEAWFTVMRRIAQTSGFDGAGPGSAR